MGGLSDFVCIIGLILFVPVSGFWGGGFWAVGVGCNLLCCGGLACLFKYGTCGRSVGGLVVFFFFWVVRVVYVCKLDMGVVCACGRIVVFQFGFMPWEVVCYSFLGLFVGFLWGFFVLFLLYVGVFVFRSVF